MARYIDTVNRLTSHILLVTFEECKDEGRWKKKKEIKKLEYASENKIRMCGKESLHECLPDKQCIGTLQLNTSSQQFLSCTNRGHWQFNEERKEAKGSRFHVNNTGKCGSFWETLKHKTTTTKRKDKCTMCVTWAMQHRGVNVKLQLTKLGWNTMWSLTENNIHFYPLVKHQTSNCVPK